MLAAFAVLTLLIFGARTMLRNPDWQSEEKLYRTGLEVKTGECFSACCCV
jgi:hypothetical protein